ncbi:SbcC/MukB-like Walker B domain-containing protein [Ureibacillus acetophenoni]|uniref:Nuclease SbcCD subunit C n=1 Tax=Ureibacillus acetophenoni TaxID=614649 RepID=A0A285UUP4_9BACL|nr:AAA family ATPase [Ureibacillus acetophenoni]SOC43961.1 exonuclease SbcC [Ureibacillus acetophenoni]
MKPIKLTMRAFGPYKNEETIDFTKLHDNRLFVISGSTGAGKTTIFDGICFALYGSASGSDRKDVKMLRSDFADDDIHTAVEFVFELHGKKYRVLRQVPHVKKGRKGATGEKYELFEVLSNNEEVPAVERQKVTDINKKIQDLIGLNFDQFSQIVMLPQGEFRKLLTSQTENKEEILRKIFKTDRYGQIANKLETKKQQAEQKLNEAKVLKNSYLSHISGALPYRESNLFTLLDRNSNIYQIQEALQEELNYYQQKIEEDRTLYEKTYHLHKQKYENYLANKSLNERIDTFHQKVLRLQKLEEQKTFYETLKLEYDSAIRVSQIEPLYKQIVSVEIEYKGKQKKLIDVQHQLDQSKEKLIEAKAIYEEELQNQPVREESIKRVMDLEKLLPLFEEIEKHTKIVERLQIDVETKKAEYTKLVSMFNEKKSSIQLINQSIEQLEEKTENIQSAVDEQNRLKDIVQAFNQYNEVQLHLNKLNEEFTNASQQFKEAEREYELEESKWLSNQAAILATKLIPGEACPVCGSTDHQLTSQELTEMIDENALKQLKQIRSKKEQRVFEIKASLNSTNERLESINNELKKLNASIDEKESIQLKYDESIKLVASLQKDIQQLSEQRKQLKKLMLEEQELEIQKTQAEKQYREKSNQLLEQSTILEQQQLSIPVEIHNLNELQVALIEAQNAKSVLLKKWENAQNAYQESQTELAKNEEILNLTSQQVIELSSKLLHSKEDFERALETAGFEDIEQFQNAKRTEIEQKHLYEQFMNYTKELHSITAQVNEEKEQLKDKEKIDLSELEEQLDLLKRDYERALQHLNSSTNYADICLDYAEKLEKIANDIIQLEETSSQIVDLYNLLRGQNNKKISFERYIQMGYLEQITEAANIRLRNLSNGQFYLQCSDRQESHGRQSGLSLDVYDTYTGQSRDVKSLSGGEKFNASLCLALGMADVIQSYQGNVQIDTMFIDEGFGSLDEESLMKAIDTLIDIQKSGRMIGVISHVAELKAAMPAILQVEKLKEGYSKTSIIVK